LLSISFKVERKKKKLKYLVAVRTGALLEAGKLLAVLEEDVGKEKVPALDHLAAVGADALKVLADVVANVVGLVEVALERAVALELGRAVGAGKGSRGGLAVLGPHVYVVEVGEDDLAAELAKLLLEPGGVLGLLVGAQASVRVALVPALFARVEHLAAVDLVLVYLGEKNAYVAVEQKVSK
jgi:hypothetical protein